ncbi:hypothetical protein [Cronobacter sakazakii]|uniref:hypothetical protein n=1 Tax=Cronobacter sakazakii TaxID=28141 RepID=UPI0011E49418|nr:hypothetical protein [Cronobacter sakazakii]MDT3608972.1 hypothetical protein [Cronobacter sakazakii]TYD51261.1 hypothetical protein FNN14_06390 [Cronobacter sakazakii]
MLPEIPTLALAFMVWLLIFIPSYKIATRAGFGWSMALLLTLPGLNIIAWWCFACMKWPARRYF